MSCHMISNYLFPIQIGRPTYYMHRKGRLTGKKKVCNTAIYLPTYYVVRYKRYMTYGSTIFHRHVYAYSII
jgi:hypothetical protein